MIKAVLSNASHSEYGRVTLSFPIPNDQYDQTIEMLQTMELGFSRNRDCRVVDLVYDPQRYLIPITNDNC